MQPIEHFADKKRIEDELKDMFPNGAVYLMSEKKRQKNTDAGRIFECSHHVAALMLIQETHRLAKPAEIANWLEDQMEKGKKLKEQQAKKEAKVNLDLAGLVRELRNFPGVQPEAPAPVKPPAAPKPQAQSQAQTQAAA